MNAEKSNKMAKSSLRNLGRVAQQRKPEPPTVDLVVVTPIQNGTVAAAVRALTPTSDVEAVRDSLPEDLREAFMKEAKIVAEVSVLIQMLQGMGLAYGSGYHLKTEACPEDLQIVDVVYTLSETGVKIRITTEFASW
mgnify:CR=1 FL=1